MKKVESLMKLKKSIIFLLIMFMLMPFLIPIKSYAHNAFFLQVLIDDSTMTFLGNVVQDDASFFNAESKHLENQLGEFKSLIGKYEHGMDLTSLQKTDDWKSGSGSDWMPLTFPGKEVKGKNITSSKVKNDRTNDDAEKAYIIKDLLLPGLNDVLAMKNNNKKYDSINELVTETHNLLNTKDGETISLRGKDYTVHWGARSPKSKSDIPKGTGLTSKDYVWFESPNGKNDYEFVWRVPKGYIKTGNTSDKDAFRLANAGIFDYTGDTEYITWGMLTYEASYAYYSHNYTMKYAGEQVKPGPLASAVTDMLSWVHSGIKNILGLYSMDELIFNQGIRGSLAYEHGIMPKTWSHNVTFYHWIFQAIAWILIAFAIVKSLVQKNLSTINPAMRVSLIQQIQSLLITGFILACTYPIIGVLMKLNVHLVDIFYGASERTFSQTFSEISAYSNVLGAVIVQFVYLFINILMNYIYILRAITVSLLIASAPLFIVSLAFGGKFKQGFITWIKELCANIFLQSFHAFALSFFTGIAISTRGIETLVVLGALIPLTDFFRQLIMGSSGETSGKLGMAGLKTTLNTIENVGSGLADVAREKSKESKKTQNEEARQQKTASESNIQTKDSSKFKCDTNSNGQGSTNTKLSPNDSGSILNRLNSTEKAMESKAVSLSNYKDGKSGLNKNTTLGQMINNKEQLEKNAKTDALIKNGAKGIGGALKVATKGAVGAGLVGAGIATSMVTGESKNGSKLIRKGGSLVGSAGSDLKAVGTKTAQYGSNRVVYGGNKGYEAITDKLKEDKNTIPDIIPPETCRDSRFYQSQAFSETTGEGDILVHRNASSMKQEGIEDVVSDSKTSSFTYTPHVTDFNEETGNLEFDSSTLGSFNNKDLANLNSYVKAFDNPKSVEANECRKLGIENAGIVEDSNGNKRIKVTYNQVGQEALGFKSISKVGTDRIVEKKSPYQNDATRKTIDIPTQNLTQNPTSKQQSSKQQS